MAGTPPPPRVPLWSPLKAGRKFCKRESSWHRRHRSKILAVSLKHWKGRGGGGEGERGLAGTPLLPGSPYGPPPPPPAVYSRSSTSLPGPQPRPHGPGHTWSRAGGATWHAGQRPTSPPDLQGAWQHCTIDRMGRPWRGRRPLTLSRRPPSPSPIQHRSPAPESSTDRKSRWCTERRAEGFRVRPGKTSAHSMRMCMRIGTENNLFGSKSTKSHSFLLFERGGHIFRTTRAPCLFQLPFHPSPAGEGCRPGACKNCRAAAAHGPICCHSVAWYSLVIVCASETVLLGAAELLTVLCRPGSAALFRPQNNVPRPAAHAVPHPRSSAQAERVRAVVGSTRPSLPKRPLPMHPNQGSA